MGEGHGKDRDGRREGERYRLTQAEMGKKRGKTDRDTDSGGGGMRKTTDMETHSQFLDCNICRPLRVISGLIDLWPYNRSVKRRNFVVDFVGNRSSGGNINQQLMFAIQ